MKRIDISQHLGAMKRETKEIERDGHRIDVLTATRTFDGSLEDVWDAITNPERIPRWFMPISGDFRLGGRYQLEGNAAGEITACEPPQRLAVTWEFGGGTSWVEVRLTAETRERTRLVLEHTSPIWEEFKKKYGPGAGGVGWELGLMGLALHLAGALDVDPKSMQSWPATDPDGKAFVRGSSAGWADAAIAAGTSEAEARAAEAQTTAFYTGEPVAPSTEASPA